MKKSQQTRSILKQKIHIIGGIQVTVRSAQSSMILSQPKEYYSEYKQSTLFIGGLTNAIAESDLKTYFEKFGTVIEANKIYCFKKKEVFSRGFAFIRFDNSDSVNKVLSLNLDHYIKNIKIECKRIKPECKDVDEREAATISFKIPEGHLQCDINQYPVQTTITPNPRRICLKKKANNDKDQPSQIEAENSTKIMELRPFYQRANALHHRLTILPKMTSVIKQFSTFYTIY